MGRPADPLIPLHEHQLYGRERDGNNGQWEMREHWHRQVPERQRAELVTLSRIPLERILAVDEEGDQAHPMPIFYIEPLASGRLFDDSERLSQLEYRPRFALKEYHDADPALRISFFNDAPAGEAQQELT